MPLSEKKQSTTLRPEEIASFGDTEQQCGSSTRRPLIEIGWIVAGRLEEPDRKAVNQARAEATRWFEETFPEFEWRIPLVERDELVRTQKAESVLLLDYGVTERNFRHWDFTLVITQADLESYYKADALSVVSRSLQTAAISTVRIDPRAYLLDIESQQRIEVMAGRIRSLVIHVIGHLGGLEHVDNPESFMFGFGTVDDLDRSSGISQQQRDALLFGLREVADARLEEQADMRRIWRPRFYAHALWINRRQVGKAVLQAKPWQFPFRLSRLTTAAASAMLVLMITAEAWELALNQSVGVLAVLAALAITLTTLYVVVRQRLFVRRERARLSELSVVTNVSTLAIVLVGMTTTFVLLALITLVLGHAFFGPTLIADWADLKGNPRGVSIYVQLAIFVASTGLFIGALGATFESHHYFRHITFVDEEI